MPGGNARGASGRFDFAKLNRLARAGDHVAVAEFLKSMKQSHFQSDLISCSTLINACERGNQWQPALDVLEQMSTESIAPDDLSFNCALRALRGSAVRGDEAWLCTLTSLQQMGKASVEPVAATYNAAVLTCDEQIWPCALKYLDHGEIRNVQLETQSFNSAIAVLPWRLTCQLLHQLSKEQVQIDRITLNSATQALAKCSREDLQSPWLMALHLLGTSLSRSLRPGHVALCVTLSACREKPTAAELGTGAWRPALILLEQWTQLLDLQILTAALMVAEQEWQVCLSLFRTLQEKMAPDAVCYNFAVGSCEAASCWRNALSLCQEALSKGEANVMTVNMAASSCQRSGRWEEATWILSSLPRHKLQPNLVSWNTALSSCPASHWFMTLHLLREVDLALRQLLHCLSL